MTPEFQTYTEWARPWWAPPAWVFGPVWTVLYALIAVSFGYVLYLFVQRKISIYILLPFVLNLCFNFVFTYIQFYLQDLWLASVDIILVLGTLIWAMIVIHPYARWVTYINIPYLAWVSFATTLQITITLLNT